MEFSVNLKDIDSSKLILDFGRNPLIRVEKQMECRLVAIEKTNGIRMGQLQFENESEYIMFIMRYLK